MTSADRQPEPLDFRRAIICALPREFDAIQALFDEHYYVPAQRHHGDPNFYPKGRIGSEYLVLTCLAEMGKGSAASAASTLRVSFPRINLALVVGICGGVPFPTEDTELIMGDVIISHHVVDFGRQYPDWFEQKGSTRRGKEWFQDMHVKYLRQLEEWCYPAVEHDRLFPSSTRHTDISGASNSCDRAGCQGKLVQRARLDTQNTPRPRVHNGRIASGDTVMKSAEHRDQMARTFGIVGFEMEGAGVCNSLSCLIIKGACDYADSHKNKIWQDYAAASAAACAKGLLECLSELKAECTVNPSAHNLTQRAEDLWPLTCALRSGHVCQYSGPVYDRW
ncbi:nucleoside phosphorylase domain-containing protein [Aspergillus germanicus]